MSRPPAYKPHALLEERGAWDTDRPKWRTPTSVDEATRVAAAQLQHALARAVWKKLRNDGLSVADLAAVNGKSEDQMWRKLSGTVPASPADLALWAWLTGAALSAPRYQDAFEGLTPTWPAR